MTNFNNTLTSKIISLIIAVSFLLADLSYAGAYQQGTLRVPVGGKDIYDRMGKAIRKRVEARMAVLSEVREKPFDQRSLEHQKAWLRKYAYGNEALLSRLEENIEAMGGPEVFHQSLNGFSETYLKELLTRFDLIRVDLERNFGRKSIQELFRSLLIIQKADDYSFGIVHALDILGSIDGGRHSSADIIQAILSYKGAHFEKAYIFLWFLTSMGENGISDQFQKQLEDFKQAALTFLDDIQIMPTAQIELGYLLEESQFVSNALLKQAVEGNQDALRILVLSPQLTKEVWQAIDEEHREMVLTRIINSFLENSFNEVINQQAHLIADLTPGWVHRPPLDGAPRRQINRKLVKDFLSEAGISLSFVEHLENLLNPEMFRFTAEGLIVTPIYMITRATRGGDYIDTLGPIDIARGLAPYSFAYPGMTNMYVRRPTIHEIDLVIMAMEMNERSVWKVQEDDTPAIYTFTKIEIPRNAYSSSYVIDEQDRLSVYKRSARIHYIERWYKQIIFSNLNALQATRNPEEARYSILRVKDSIDKLRGLSAIYKDRLDGYSTYCFNSLPDRMFEDVLAQLIQQGGIETAYQALMETKTMRLLFLEAENIRNTYEDYQLRKAPSAAAPSSETTVAPTQPLVGRLDRAAGNSI